MRSKISRYSFNLSGIEVVFGSEIDEMLGYIRYELCLLAEPTHTVDDSVRVLKAFRKSPGDQFVSPNCFGLGAAFSQGNQARYWCTLNSFEF